MEAAVKEQQFVDACHETAKPYRAVVVYRRCYRFENAEGDLVRVQVKP